MATQHSPIGASVCERYWNCPGSLNLFGHLKNPPSYYAAEGTVAHEIAEDHLRSMIQIDSSGNDGAAIAEALFYQDRLGAVIKVEEDNTLFRVEVTSDMLEAVGEYVDFIESLMDQYDASYNDLQVEVEFNLAHIDEEAWGTADAVLLALRKKRLVIIDYKHGAGISVEVVDNKQTRYYGLGAYRKLPAKIRELIETVEFVIVQPRCPHADGTIRREIVAIDELMDWEKGLIDAIGRVRDGDTTLKAGSHCKFCPGKPHCEEAKNEVMRLTEVDLASMDIDDALFSGPPDVKTLSPKQIAHLLGFIPFIKDWCDSLLDHAYFEAERGVEIPGYMLADKRSKRKWRDGSEEDLEFLLGQKAYVTKLVSPAQAEKLLPKKKKAILSDLWEKPEPGKTLVKRDDNKVERLPSIQSDFIDIDFDSLEI